MKVIVTLLCLLVSLPLYADTHTASTCDKADIETAITASSDGDLVTVPAGTCVWTSQLAEIISKQITLQGAGIDTTIIQWDREDVLGRMILVSGTKAVRITGFTFTIHTNGPQEGVIVMNATANGWRIDHNKFLDVASKAIAAHTNASGLIDHNQLTGAVKGMDIDGVYYGDAAWLIPWALGTDDAVFVEDNIYNISYPTYAGISCHYDGRYVFRYNTGTVKGGLTTHGADSGDLGGRGLVEYENQITASEDTAIYTRGGSAVIFNNTFTGYNIGLNLMNFRTCYGVSWPPPAPFTCNPATNENCGRCDGTSALDGNQARTGNSGTHSGANNAAILTDGTKSWTSDAFIGWQIYNTTDGSKCTITDNDATTVTCTLTGGTENDWDTGDVYKVTSGWPCKDQIGYSSGAEGSQVADPIYFWNNTIRHGTMAAPGPAHELDDTGFLHVSLAGYTCTQPSTGDQIIQNSEWIYGVRPGYSAYTYPHPLNVDDASPIISSITSSPSNTSAAITWTTDELADSHIHYGLTAGYGSEVTLDATLVTSHGQEITGLLANTLYHYAVISKDAAANSTTSGDGTFTTGGSVSRVRILRRR